jgi:hypothetical protein
MGMAIAEYSCPTFPSLDGTPVNNRFSGTNPTSSPITTTVSNDLLFSFCAVGAITGTVAGAGFTTRVSGPGFNDNCIIDDLDAGAPGSKTALYSATSDDFIVCFAAFKEAGAGVPAEPTFQKAGMGLVS